MGPVGQSAGDVYPFSMDPVRFLGYVPIAVQLAIGLMVLNRCSGPPASGGAQRPIGAGGSLMTLDAPAQGSEGGMTVTQVQVGGRALEASDTIAATIPAASSPMIWAAEYYRRIAPALLPHLSGRPVVLKTCSDSGSNRAAGVPLPIPAGLTRHQLADAHREPVECCMIHDPLALQCVGMLGAELHVLLAREGASAHPAAIVLELDPTPPAGMVECVGVALDLRDMFAEVGLRCWAKTCGGRGLHLYVPLNTPVTFSQARTFARLVAETYADRYPDLATTNARKRVYPGQVFMDWRANQEDQPSLCVYSLCSSGWHPTVSTPVTWQELEAAWVRQDGSALTFGPDQVVERIARKGDLFDQVLALQQHLPV